MDNSSNRVSAVAARRIITYFLNEVTPSTEMPGGLEYEDGILLDCTMEVITDVLHLIREIRGDVDAPYAYLAEAVVRYHAEVRPDD